jgi:hypothetical protein
MSVSSGTVARINEPSGNIELMQGIVGGYLVYYDAAEEDAQQEGMQKLRRGIYTG